MTQEVDGGMERGAGDAPFWARLGFGSLEEYLDEIEATWERIGLSRRSREIEIPAAPIPGSELSDLPEPPRPAVRQVGVKLRDSDYELLARAARVHGVAPSTLARMLVSRGARAILDSATEDHRRD